MARPLQHFLNKDKDKQKKKDDAPKQKTFGFFQDEGTFKMEPNLLQDFLYTVQDYTGQCHVIQLERK